MPVSASYLPETAPQSHTLATVSFTKRRKIAATVFCVLAATVAWLGVREYRGHIRCAVRNTVLQERVEKLRHDAHDQLRVGMNKAQVIRFFDERQIQVAFGYGVALGGFQTTGCSPFGCGADTAIVVVSVAVDSQGTVVGEPHVSGIYDDCL